MIMNSKYKRLIRDMGLFALGALGSKLITFLLLPLYTHILSTEEYGVSDLVFTLGQLLLPFFSLAIFNGLLRYGLMQEVKKEDALYCATKVFVIGSFAAVILTPLLQLVPSIKPWRWFLCGHVISLFAVSNSLIYLKVKDKNKIYALLSILQTLVLIVCNIIFLIGFDLGVRGYLLSYIVSNSVTASCAMIFGGMFQDFRNAKYDSNLMKAMVMFSLPYILNDISWWAIHSSNKLLIEFMLGSAILGIYTTSSKIPSLINVIASIFTQAWGLSSIKEYDSSNDTGFYSNVFNYFMICILGVCICVVSIIKMFMKIYVSVEFFESWQYIPLLLLGAAFSAISSFAGSLLGAMKKPQNLMWSTFVASIVNVVSNIVLIPICGIWGAVMGTFAAHVVVAIFRLICVKKHMKINYNVKRNIPMIIVVLLHAILVSINFHIGLVSIIAIVVYLCLISGDIKSLYQIVQSKIRTHL